MNELKEKINIEDMIYEVRNRQVMLDSDLAKLYQCKNGTKEVNQAVRNNLNKFPTRFSWKLSDSESNELLVKKIDQKNETRGGKYKNPRVFTEQGVAMLATILKSKVAVEVSIAIMDAFVSMRKYISDNLIEQRYINNMVLKHDNDIKLLQDTFDKFKPSTNEIYFDGQIYDAYSKIVDILKEADKKVIIIDNYADKSVLDIISSLSVNVILITKKFSLLKNIDIEKYNKQYHNLKIRYDNTFHDRYFILDNKKVYHLGSSINHAGSKTFSINKIEDEFIIVSLIKKIEKIK